MAALDRTLEFQRIADSRRAQQQRLPKAAPTAPTRSEFAARASAIGADIYTTASKLGKLTQLAQSKSLFQDPTVEINELTHIIKQDITSLNSKLASLQSSMAQAQTAGSAKKQRASHSTSVVDSLKTKLYDATREFQDVLHTRSHNIQLLQIRRENLSGSATGGSGGGSGGGFASSSGAAAASVATGGAGGGGAFEQAAGASQPHGVPRNRFAPPQAIFELAPPTTTSSDAADDESFGGGRDGRGGRGGVGDGDSSSSSGGGSSSVGGGGGGGGGAIIVGNRAFAEASWASPSAKPAGMCRGDDGEVVIDMSSLGAGGQMVQEQQMLPMSSAYLDSRAQVRAARATSSPRLALTEPCHAGSSRQLPLPSSCVATSYPWAHTTDTRGGLCLASHLAQAVDAVQSTIVELGSIFQQLAEMVNAQGQQLQRVDENVEDSLANVREGHSQLQRYWRGMSTNRGLVMKVFAVMLFFIVLWGTLFA
jgi:hypothetical protein